ncbi:tetratricopeptide repeat protein [bacterium]|jgi:Ca-activated chloride channel homolog|nr:tetratricopeptide repeat protein [bacterium]
MKKITLLCSLVLIFSTHLSAVTISESLENNKAIDYAEDGHYDKSIETFSHLLTNEAITPKILKNLGDVYAKDQNMQKAEEAYLLAIPNLSPEDQRDTYYNLGNIHYAKKEFDAAKKAYISALQLDPDHLLSKNNLELTNYQIKKLEKQKKEQEKDDPNKKKDKKKKQKKKPKPEEMQKDEEVKKAKQQEKKKREEKKKNAKSILKLLEKKEQEARQKHLDRLLPKNDQLVEKDW